MENTIEIVSIPYGSDSGGTYSENDKENCGIPDFRLQEESESS